jgi:NAD(P)-dependent dehydrogenase (short-subunit alcohol dehydrogenase family)
MDSEIAVVTGSSSGFGLLTCLELAKRGFHVIATMRNTEKRTDLMAKAKQLRVDNRIEIKELDVTSAQSIEQFKIFVETLGSVDVLVNNAGYAGAGFIEEIPLEEYRKQFETNVFGLIAVTQAVIPVMREHRKGKIINISSISGKIGFPGLSPYVASKFAIEGWSECLRLELKPFSIDVALVEPGSYQTNIWSTGKQITDKSLQADSPYYGFMQKIEGYLQMNESQYGDPQDVANKIGDIVQHKESTLRYPIGKGVKIGILFKNAVSWKRWEKLILKRLNH